MGKARVFVSFDFDNDKILKDFIIGQSKLDDSPFDVVDCSLKEAAPQWDWENKARRAISGADRIVVMLGKYTFTAAGVLKEVQMANELRIPICQIIGYKDSNPSPVPNAGTVYKWNWDNLKKLFSV